MAPDRIGILAGAASVPTGYLDLAEVGRAYDGSSKGRRAVAHFDEDAVTLAASAALAAVERAGGVDEPTMTVLATTAAPYKVRASASIVAAVAGTTGPAPSRELAGGARGGVAALVAAADAVAAGRVRRALVAAGERRPAEPGSDWERTYGDGGAAVVVGSGDGVLAELVGWGAVTDEVVEPFALDTGSFAQPIDMSLWRKTALAPSMIAAANAALADAGLAPKDVAGAVVASDDPRTAKLVGAQLGVPVVAPDVPLGAMGAAEPLLLALRALEDADPGAHVLVVGFGNGAEAVVLRATEALAQARTRVAVTADIKANSRTLPYTRYLRHRGLLAAESEVVEPLASQALTAREAASLYRLEGLVCGKCDAIQFPKRAVCWRCGAREGFDTTTLGRTGSLFTYTAGTLYPTPDVATIMGVAQLDGEGRFYTQLTEALPEEVSVGMQVELVFRLMHRGGGFNNYFWKLRPVKDAAGSEEAA